MQENINIPDSTITSALTFRNLVLMNMQQLTNFPYIEKDFDALTDYELLSLVVKFLNDVIDNQNEQNDSITNLYNAFLALQTYVNNTKDTLENAFNTLDDYVRNYFANLDVQDEINNKLDAMAEDGSLIALIASYIPEIYPEMYGAVGDGETDDTTAIQTAINTSHTLHGKMNFMEKTYLISSPLTVYSNLEINGNNATIKTEDAIKMFVTSGASYLNIHDLKLVGNDETDCYGFYLTCYYSDFNNLTIGNVYTGFYIDTAPAAGTLVENRINNIKVYHYKYAGLYLGVTDNNKATDGFLTNVIVSGDSGATYGIFIGSSAGWVIDGVHVYGQNDRGIHLDNSNATNVSNFYIEYFTSYGLVMSKTQAGCNVTNGYIRHRTSGTTGDAIHVEVSAVLPALTHGGNLTNINIRRDDVTTGRSIYIAGGPTHAWNATNIIIDSTAGKTIANDCTNINYNTYGIHKENEYKLSFNNVANVLSYINGYQLKGISPTTTTIEFDLPTLANNIPTAILLLGVAGQYTSQSGKFYIGYVYVVKDNSNNLHAWIKNSDIDEIFSTSPTITADTTNNKITLTVAVNTTLYGRLYANILS